MLIKKLFCAVYLIGCILEVKSDTSQLPIDRRNLDLLTRFLQDQNFQNEIITILETPEERAERELHSITRFSETIYERTELIRRVQTTSSAQTIISENDRLRINPELNRLENGLRASITFLDERRRTAGRLLEQQRAQHRLEFMLHLQELFNLQERILTRYELAILSRNLDAYRQYEQQQRAQELPLQDQALRDQRTREQIIHDQLQLEVRTRINRLYAILERGDDSIITFVHNEVDVINQHWLNLNSVALHLSHRRANERLRLQQQQQLQMIQALQRAQKRTYPNDEQSSSFTRGDENVPGSSGVQNDNIGGVKRVYGNRGEGEKRRRQR